jgi:hypothetical protein
MMLDSDQPSLLRCLAAAVEGHDAMRKQRLAPPRTEPEPPDNPLVKRALDQLQDGDLQGCVATMRTLDKGYDPNQPRDPNGKWTHGAANTAGRIAHATTAVERALRTLRELPEDRADELPDHLDNLSTAVTALERELQALPADARELAVESRRALASARDHLQRVQDNLDRVWDYFSRPRPQSGNGRGNGQGNGFGKAVAPLIIWKREDTAMRHDDIDQLEAQCDSLLRKVANALGEDLDDDDDAGVTDTWSEAADARASGNNASNGDDDDGIDDDEGDDHRVNLGKRTVDTEFTLGPRDPVGPTRFDAEHQPYPHSLGTTDAVQEPVRSKFDAMVENIVRDEGVSKTTAMTLARQRYPRIYQSHQQANAASSTSAQRTAHAGYGSGYRKSAATSYEQLVAAEMAKGVTMEIAAVRIANTYGTARQFPRTFGKSSDPGRLVKRLDARIDEVVADTGLTRCEALRELRKSGELYL